jgi:hypothetical protein
MDYELKEGFGNSFKNDFKEKKEQPDFTGEGMYKGEPIRLALWKRKTKKGETYLGWAISEKKEEKKKEKTVFQDIDDSIPF